MFGHLKTVQNQASAELVGAPRKRQTATTCGEAESDERGKRKGLSCSGKTAPTGGPRETMCQFKATSGVKTGKKR